MNLSLNPVLEVEASIAGDSGKAEPLTQQVFYILKRNPDEILRANDLTSEIVYVRVINALRSHAIRFFITDSEGKAEIKQIEIRRLLYLRH